jgi:hypothetical protein
MATNSHVGFCVYEFGDDPSVVTELINIAPTESWPAGERIHNHPSATWRKAKWELKSPLPLEMPVEDHLTALLPLLEGKAEDVSKVIERHEAEIRCAVYYHEEHCNQGFHLGENVVARMAKLGLSIDFDLYFLGGDDVPASDEV